MCSLRSSQNVPYCVEREHIREEINIFYTDGIDFFQGSSYVFKGLNYKEKASIFVRFSLKFFQYSAEK